MVTGGDVKDDAKDAAAREHSLRCRDIRSTSTGARGEIRNGIQGSWHIEIVVQRCPYFCNIWTRIGPTPTPENRAQLRHELSGRVQHTRVPFKSIPAMMRHKG